MSPAALRADLVLDCSVVAHWLFLDESDMPGANYGEALLGRMHSLVPLVPSLWHVEVASMLRKGVLSKRAVQPLEAYVRRLKSFDLRTDTAVPDLQAVAELSLACGTSAYDATYLLLCQKHKLPLATLDERLKPCAARAGVKLHTLN